jgi:uncharacterized protein (TIGR03000 family)
MFGGHGCNGGLFGGHGCHGGGHGCHGGFGGLFSHGGRGCHGGCNGGGCYGGGCYGGGACYGGAGCVGGGAGCVGGGAGCVGGGVAPPPPPPVRERVVPPEGGKKKEKETLAPAPATIYVSLPSEAKLTIDDAATTSTSAVRVFASPALQPGQEYYYTLKAEIVRDGKTIPAVKRIPVHAGEESRVTFEFPAATAVAAK